MRYFRPDYWRRYLAWAAGARRSLKFCEDATPSERLSLKIGYRQPAVVATANILSVANKSLRRFQLFRYPHHIHMIASNGAPLVRKGVQFWWDRGAPT
jgi:hypothetical protein